ncbi:MAG TPA: hypothetical protein VF262_12420 [Burkholderiales bacterium]
MRRLLALAMLILLGACGQMPQNAQEFRQQIPTAFMGSVQTFEANRPYREVSKTFQAKAPECLNVAVRTVDRSATSSSNILTTYRPTVIANEQRTEMHLQRHMQGNVIVPGKEPEGGHYAMVVDVTPIDRNRTKVVIYGPSRGLDAVVKAVNGWATGQNVGCPDMTKN